MKNEIILFTDGDINIEVQILSEKVCRKLILNIISRGIEL